MVFDNFAARFLIETPVEFLKHCRGDVTLAADVHDTKNGDATNTTRHRIHDEAAETMSEKYQVVNRSYLKLSYCE